MNTAATFSVAGLTNGQSVTLISTVRIQFYGVDGVFDIEIRENSGSGAILTSSRYSVGDPSDAAIEYSTTAYYVHSGTSTSKTFAVRVERVSELEGVYPWGHRTVAFQVMEV